MTETLSKPTQDATDTPVLQPESRDVFEQKVQALQKDWDTNPRWEHITRDYTPEEVVKLQGT
ncbi:hypothetical protein M3B43_12455, partial [Nesterenkonia massiliensis]